MTDAADLAQSLREVLGRAQRALREQGGRRGLTASQTEALGYVFRDGPMTITELAGRQHVRPQSMGATVGVLRERGLVTVSPDPGDGRRKVVAVTDAARDLIAEGRSVRTDWLAKQLETLSPAERQTLAAAHALLDRLFP
ncbi:helix-turn-helix domain-containing protein [Amycolatopsis endophytica]|uniref:DNA-binding MarR family transcriptional regulator n=1 Tax=Amycolatopsis endophytica TaxID=860233 RepID=A0A853BCE2_9PSEU|nr:MarR family transcriptional regulator [Amycolatopsis endophytica]NYI93043.1 DNA-binding MarR family transcriptional regulator [Amycolatopsis endophytica]